MILKGVHLISPSEKKLILNLRSTIGYFFFVKGKDSI
jgi:hypothetical protein